MTLLNKRKYSNSRKRILKGGSRKIKKIRNQKGSGNVVEMANKIKETRALNEAGKTATNAASKVLNNNNEENTVTNNNNNMNNSGSSTLVPQQEKGNESNSVNNAVEAAINNAGETEEVVANNPGETEEVVANNSGEAEEVAVNNAGEDEEVVANNAGNSEEISTNNQSGNSHNISGEEIVLEQKNNEAQPQPPNPNNLPPQQEIKDDNGNNKGISENDNSNNSEQTVVAEVPAGANSDNNIGSNNALGNVGPGTNNAPVLTNIVEGQNNNQNNNTQKLGAYLKYCEKLNVAYQNKHKEVEKLSEMITELENLSRI